MKRALTGAGKGIAVKAAAGVVAVVGVGAVAVLAGPSLVSAATGTASSTTAAAGATSAEAAADASRAAASASASASAAAAAAAQAAQRSAQAAAALQARRTLSQPGLTTHRPAPQPVPAVGPTPTAVVPVGVEVGLIDEACRASGNSAAPYHLTFTAVFSDGHHMPGLSVDSTSSSVDEVYVSYGGRSMFQVASGADFAC